MYDLDTPSRVNLIHNGMSSIYNGMSSIYNGMSSIYNERSSISKNLCLKSTHKSVKTQLIELSGKQ